MLVLVVSGHGLQPCRSRRRYVSAGRWRACPGTNLRRRIIEAWRL